MKNRLYLALFLLCLASCKQLDKERLVKSVLNGWTGKTIIIPDSTCFSSRKE
mgnify:FL=1